MINKKRIEEAASKYSDKYLYLDEDNLPCYTYACEEAFKAGIDWLLDNLWHDASEEPKENHDILIEALNGTYTEYAAYRHNSAQLWSEFVDRSHTTRWFYINDLLKGGKCV